MQHPITYQYSQTISSFIYKVGFGENKYDFSTAVGLYSSLINLVFLFSANWISKKLTDNSIF